MKKRIIWILIGVMVVALSVLIWMQVSYMKSLIEIQTSELDASVHRSLSRVAYLLEQDETRHYLEMEMSQIDEVSVSNESTKKLYNIPFFREEGDSVSILEDITPLRENGDFHHLAIVDESTVLNGGDFQDELREKYLNKKEMLDEVVYRIIHETVSLPISQRVDFNKLTEYITKEFGKNGLVSMPFSFCVKEKDGRDVYFSENFNYDATPDYRQILFVNDPGNKHAVLYVYFPKRNEYIRRPMLTFIPTIAFSIVIVFVFVFTVMVIFRQKKLSDMKNDFISNMTHELKTPVSSISLASQMLKDPDVIKDALNAARIVTIISDESKRLNMLIEKVLQMSMFERSGNTTLAFKEVNVTQVIEKVMNSFRIKVANCGGTMRFELNAEESLISADELHLTNVLYNLLDNSLKYKDEERPLELVVSTRNENGFLLISVKDNGIGISKENQKKVFDRFYRVTKGNIHTVRGFGLGLAYVNSIVKSHKGTITIGGDYGVGTEFTIYLPLIKN